MLKLHFYLQTLLFLGLFWFAMPVFACHNASLTLDDVVRISPTDYRLDLTFCAGSGESISGPGGDDATLAFAFQLNGGATLSSFPASMMSPSTGNTFTGTLDPTGTELTYDGGAGNPWACVIRTCGGAGATCTSLSLITNGLPTFIDLVGIEGGGDLAAGCPLRVFTNCTGGSSTFGGTATAVLPDLYRGYPPMECTDITAAATGGSGSYAYLWNTGETTATINVCPIKTTDYEVLITDLGTGCHTKVITTVTVEDIRCSGSGMIWICYAGRSRCASIARANLFLGMGATLGLCRLSLRGVQDPEQISSQYETIISQTASAVEVGFLSDKDMEITARLLAMNGRELVKPRTRAIRADWEGTMEIPKNGISPGIYILHLQAKGLPPKTAKIYISH